MVCRYFEAKSGHPDGFIFESLAQNINDRAGHDFRYSIDSQKLKKETGWSIKNDFETSLHKTINALVEVFNSSQCQPVGLAS